MGRAEVGLQKLEDIQKGGQGILGKIEKKLPGEQKQAIVPTLIRSPCSFTIAAVCLADRPHAAAISFCNVM